MSAPDMPAGVAVDPEISALYEEMVENRRWMHAHPELSFQEHETARFIADKLRSYGLTVGIGIGRTGVVGILKGKGAARKGGEGEGKGEDEGRRGDGRCIALRADMDALPLPETADIPYKSKNAGVMHACGHDGHCASLLAAAKVLAARADRISGTVKFVFQPAEEGFGGAREMIVDGVLSGVDKEGKRQPDALGPEVDEIYGIHLWSYEPLGRVCIKHGPFMAASDKFEIDVLGHGGHGAAPQGTVDAIVEAAHVVTALQTIVSRNRDPLDPAVLTVGTIEGGHGYNIIADKVRITGTTRTFTTETKALVQRRMEEVCCGVAATFGGEVQLHYHDGYPATVNSHPFAVDRVKAAGSAIVGAGNLTDSVMTCGAEDFSYFIREKPGAFFFVGAALPGELRPHHKSIFDFDERAMLVSASMYVRLIEDTLM